MTISYESVWATGEGERASDAPPAVSDDQIHLFESKHGIKLPESLLELYRVQNGGFSLRFECMFWSIELGNCDDMVSLALLASNYHEDQSIADFWFKQLGPLEKVIVFLGDGHFYFVLNFNRIHDGQPLVAEVTEASVRQTEYSFEQWLSRAIQ